MATAAAAAEDTVAVAGEARTIEGSRRIDQWTGLRFSWAQVVTPDLDLNGRLFGGQDQDWRPVRGQPG
jgi:hypothetical protein